MEAIRVQEAAPVNWAGKRSAIPERSGEITAVLTEWISRWLGALPVGASPHVRGPKRGST